MHFPGVKREVNFMPYGMGSARGFGFGRCSVEWPYTGRGRGGLPRCLAYGLPYGTNVADGPPGIATSEVDLLKGHARTLKQQLEAIELRIQGLEEEKEEKEK
jgi:hypothetical protein